MAAIRRRLENSASTGRAVSDDFGGNAQRAVSGAQAEDRLRGHSREARSEKVAYKSVSRLIEKSIAVGATSAITPSITDPRVSRVSDLAPMQLAGGADPMRGARSNIGLVNLAPVPIEVMVAVTDRVGDPLVTLDVVVPASTLLMVNDVFGHLDRDVRGAVARVRTTTPDGVFFAWASVIDGRSGDPAFLPAERLRVHSP